MLGSLSCAAAGLEGHATADTSRDKARKIKRVRITFKILELKVLNATSGPSVMIRQNVYRQLTEFGASRGPTDDVQKIECIIQDVSFPEQDNSRSDNGENVL